MPGVMRCLVSRALPAVLLLPLCLAAAVAAPEPRPLALDALGAPRDLPQKILGASANPFYDHLINDPRKIAQVRSAAPAVLRFPGGTLANYYN